MEYERACSILCDAISELLLSLAGPSSRAAFAAARATRDVADALHHAAGRAHDPRWYDALHSLETFLELCGTAAGTAGAPARNLLLDFLAENGAAQGRAQIAS